MAQNLHANASDFFIPGHGMSNRTLFMYVCEGSSPEGHFFIFSALHSPGKSHFSKSKSNGIHCKCLEFLTTLFIPNCSIFIRVLFFLSKRKLILNKAKLLQNLHFASKENCFFQII